MARRSEKTERDVMLLGDSNEPLSNVVSLREYIEVRIRGVQDAAIARAESQDKAVSAAMAAAQAAVLKAEMATEKRFESVNEFRESLADQSRTLMPRAEFEALHKAAQDRNEQAHATMAERFASLNARMTAIDSQHVGKSQGWSSVVSVVALIAAVLSVLLIAFQLK